MTFATLRSLYKIIGDALDDIERVYRDASLDDSSPSPQTPYAPLTSPTTPYRPARCRRNTARDDDLDGWVPFAAGAGGRTPKTPRKSPRAKHDLPSIDFPPLDEPYYPTETHAPEQDAAENLASHADVIAAANRIVAACGQMSATVHRPFLTLCDAAMSVSARF